MKDGVEFFPAVKCQRFLQIDIILGVCVARHGQFVQNNRFAISLQYLKEEVFDEVDFLHVDKHQSLLQIDTMILVGMFKCSKSSQNSKSPVS